MTRFQKILITPFVVLFAFFSLCWFVLFCRILGWHYWWWESERYVPYYGYGAWRCMLCETLKVKP